MLLSWNHNINDYVFEAEKMLFPESYIDPPLYTDVMEKIEK